MSSNTAAPIVLLDPGHGGLDAGAVNGERYEKDDNLALALAVQKLLSAQGVGVVMTRTDDSYLTLGQRTGIGNTSGAALFVSLHRNSFTNSTANGVEIWVYSTADSSGEAAARTVLNHLAEVGVQSERGVKRGNYHVLRESSMPAMLVELGFISNQEDNRQFDERFDAYAEALARGICQVLEHLWREGEVPAPRVLYRVQVGAFHNEENARAFLLQVREMGLEAFLSVNPVEESA